MYRVSVVRLMPLLAAVAFFGMATSAGAQNLLANPGFDTSLTGWTGTGTFDATQDAAGSPSSGSALISGMFPANVAIFAVTQCVTSVTPGTSYTMSGNVLATSLGSTPNVATFATVSVEWSTTPACGTPGITQATTNADTPGQAWQALATTVTAPAGSVSALVQGTILTSSSPGVFVVNFDDLVFQAVPPVPVMDGLTLLLLGVALSATAMLVLRRRRVRPV